MTEPSGFRLLWADLPEDRARWALLWEKWPDREVFAHPAYATLFCAPGERALCAAWEGRDSGVLFPLVMRPLARELWGEGAAGRFDLTSPYGYGGAFVWGPVDASAFWGAFDAWATEAGALTCFARLSLFPEQILPFGGVVEENAPNVVRTLALSPEALWMEYEHKVRKNVKRARLRGVSVEVDLVGGRLADFLSIYYATMERRGASGGYFFPPAFFEAIREGLSGQFAFFHALLGGRVVSTELVLVSHRNTYSFLGGTLEEAFDARPNDLLKHEIIMWGRAKGKAAFVMGGGYGGPDGIFRYKRAFAPFGERPFFVGKRVWDERICAQMVESKRARERASGNNWEPRPGFFPPYRG